jgi:hypothetical protein
MVAKRPVDASLLGAAELLESPLDNNALPNRPALCDDEESSSLDIHVSI